jgi:hypothetical protein
MHAAASGMRKNGSTALDPKRSISEPVTKAQPTVVNDRTSKDMANNCGGQSFNVVM